MNDIVCHAQEQIIYFKTAITFFDYMDGNYFKSYKILNKSVYYYCYCDLVTLPHFK